MDVICRICRGRYCETNDEDGWIKVDGGEILDPRHRAYNPDVITNGAMIRLKDEYRRLMWSPSWIPDVTQTGDALECPSCGAPYPDTRGRILTDGDTHTADPVPIFGCEGPPEIIPELSPAPASAMAKFGPSKIEARRSHKKKVA